MRSQSDDETLDLFERTIQERFERFHRENPHVIELLVRFAREARAAGSERAGIGLLWERLRWELIVETRGDEFRLNNDFRSRYARLISKTHPDLAGLFETRKLRAA